MAIRLDGLRRERTLHLQVIELRSQTSRHDAWADQDAHEVHVVAECLHVGLTESEGSPEDSSHGEQCRQLPAEPIGQIRRAIGSENRSAERSRAARWQGLHHELTRLYSVPNSGGRSLVS